MSDQLENLCPVCKQFVSECRCTTAGGLLATGTYRVGDGGKLEPVGAQPIDGNTAQLLETIRIQKQECERLLNALTKERDRLSQQDREDLEFACLVAVGVLATDTANPGSIRRAKRALLIATRLNHVGPAADE